MNYQIAQSQPAPDPVPQQHFESGLFFLKKKQIEQAMLAFENAFRINPEEPVYMSYLGLCRVLLRKDVKVAVALCERAAKQSVYDPSIFHNLGRVYLERGKRKQALKALLHGLRIDAGNQDILKELARMKTRSAPPFSFLHRNHPLNKSLGRLLARIGLR